MAWIDVQYDVHHLDSIRFRPIFVTHLLPCHQGQHELCIGHHRCSYHIIPVCT